MFSILAFLVSNVMMSSATQFSWLTIVLVDFQLREQCVQFWNEHNNCVNPSIRIISNLGNRRFASSAWPINNQLIKQQKVFFTTQWQNEIESVLLSAQIEGENALNPFGLSPKCDHGFASFVFSQENNETTLKPGQSASTRVANIDSHCFTAKLLIRIDEKCPHCPKPTTPTPLAQRQGVLYQINVALEGYNQRYIVAFLSLITVLSLCVFFTIFDLVFCRKNGFQSRQNDERQISSINNNLGQIAPISMTESSERIANIRRIPTLTSRYEMILDGCVNNGYSTNCFANVDETLNSSNDSEMSSEFFNSTYGYQLNTQKIVRFDNSKLGNQMDYSTISNKSIHYVFDI